ncbi:MAG: 30S ribosomal protein S4e [Candidatus Thermoplasmatota archaeon]|nr:30S ribosomal protein S4e [Candidatus Thermoplasmatota archaeon]MBU1940149.1 30S ribosomal protein S4e [Candidatus Thermoplasmatota archaeon]
MSKHLKRLAAPRAVQLHRKEHIWSVRPLPGPHPHSQTIPLCLVIRDYLSLCDTYREAKLIISQGDILVDGTQRKSHKFPCGLMDVISIPKLKTNYRILFNRKGRLTLVPISEKDAELKLCRVQNKTIIRKGKIQLNLHDGRNLLVPKNEYNTGDALRYSFKDKKINDVYKFEKGNVSLVTGGSHIGEIVTINNISIIHSSKPNLATLKSDKEFLTIADYVFPIGKTKPIISLPEVKMQ